MSASKCQMIPIAKVRVVNPRSRNKGIFEGIQSNISRVGLKRPITVCRREPDEDGTEYDLVCGQGRLEACKALGATEIPAIVTTAAREEQLLMGLVENVARREYSPGDLIAEVRNQKQHGLKTEEISRKLDLEQSYVSGIIHLLDHGEERLIREVESGRVALTVAMQIASSDDAEIQRALSEAYQDKSLRGQKLAVVRRLIAERKAFGKTVRHGGNQKAHRKPSKEALIRAYREETQRQKLLVKKAQLTESRLLVIVSALKQLLADENFVTLLRAQKLDTLPKYLAEKVGFGGQK